MKKRLTHVTNIRTILLLFFFIACLIGIIQSMNRGKANLDFYRVHQTIEYWRQQNKITAFEEFNQTLKTIHQANNTHPNNPQYLITLGLVYEWGGISVSEPAEKTAYFHKAKQHYIRAVELRPTWPGTWATLATLKWRMKEIDQQLIDYLFLADKFGENNVQVHEAWLELGFYLYKNKNVFSAKIIKGLRKHLLLMVEDPRYKVQTSALTIIKRHNVEKLACNWITNFNIDDRTKNERFCQPKTNG